MQFSNFEWFVIAGFTIGVAALIDIRMLLKNILEALKKG